MALGQRALASKLPFAGAGVIGASIFIAFHDHGRISVLSAV